MQNFAIEEKPLKDGLTGEVIGLAVSVDMEITMIAGSDTATGTYTLRDYAGAWLGCNQKQISREQGVDDATLFQRLADAIGVTFI